MTSRTIVPAIAATLILAAPAGGAPAACSTADCAEARAAVSTPSGYRKATAAERRAMNRARGLGLTRKFGWFRGKVDPKHGFVCGYRDGGKAGVGVVRRDGRWHVWRSAPSGDLQNYQAFCAG